MHDPELLDTEAEAGEGYLADPDDTSASDEYEPEDALGDDDED